MKTLLAAAAAAALLLAGAAPARAAGPRPCNGSAALCGRAFDHVVLAGAHNAMSSRALGWTIPNQSLTIPGQLRLGVRALLIDTHYGRVQPDGSVATDDDGKATGGPRGLYLCHDYCQLGATPLVAGLSGIRRWLDRHPRNVLLIDEEDHIAPADFVRAMRASGLAGHAWRGSTRRWPTLAAMIRARRQVVVLAERRAGGAAWYHPAYRGILQETRYTWPRASAITHRAAWRASCSPNRDGRHGSLFLMNHWSPPVPPATPDRRASARVNAERVLVGRARACAAVRGLLPTVIAVDQAQAGGLIAAVRRLNGV